MGDEKKQEESAAVRVLNRAFAADPEAMHAMICNRVPCNKALADDPTIVVGESILTGDTFDVGSLGLINGILDEMGLNKVAVKYYVEHDREGRKIINGFCDYLGPAS